MVEKGDYAISKTVYDKALFAQGISISDHKILHIFERRGNPYIQLVIVEPCQNLYLLRNKGNKKRDEKRKAYDQDQKRNQDRHNLGDTEIKYLGVAYVIAEWP